MPRILPLRSVAHLWKNAKTYYALLTHRDTPLHLKAVAVLAVAYLLFPFDIAPDWLIGLGFIDDLAVVSLLLGFVVKRLKKQTTEDKQLEEE